MKRACLGISSGESNYSTRCGKPGGRQAAGRKREPEVGKSYGGTGEGSLGVSETPGGPAKIRAPVAASREDPLCLSPRWLFRLVSRELPHLQRKLGRG